MVRPSGSVAQSPDALNTLAAWGVKNQRAQPRPRLSFSPCFRKDRFSGPSAIILPNGSSQLSPGTRLPQQWVSDRTRLWQRRAVRLHGTEELDPDAVLRDVFQPRNPPHQNLGKPPIPGPGITPSAQGVRAAQLSSMGSYRLRRVLRSAEGQGAVSFDSRTIEAPDLDAAIREASFGLSTSGGATVESVTLSRPTGEIVWTGARTALGTGPAAGS